MSVVAIIAALAFFGSIALIAALVSTTVAISIWSQQSKTYQIKHLGVSLVWSSDDDAALDVWLDSLKDALFAFASVAEASIDGFDYGGFISSLRGMRIEVVDKVWKQFGSWGPTVAGSYRKWPGTKPLIKLALGTAGDRVGPHDTALAHELLHHVEAVRFGRTSISEAQDGKHFVTPGADALIDAAQKEMLLEEPWPQRRIGEPV